MYPVEPHLIVEKRTLSADVILIKVRAPLIAEERKPGQFVIVQQDTDHGERIPLTIADADPVAGTVTLIFQVVGNSTRRLATLEKGDAIQNLLGPLGRPTHIEKFGTVICVGGGIGVAPMHPIAQGMKLAGNRVIAILGARNKSLVILEEEMRRIADEIVICTDDGSYGRKALVTEPLRELCGATPKPDLVVAIGPPIMMKACSEATRPFGVSTLCSLNAIMVDGTGMCGGCRVTVGSKTHFVCVDGPEFDGHQVDFDNLMQRLRSYKPREAHDDHRCKIDLQADALAGGASGQ